MGTTSVRMPGTGDGTSTASGKAISGALWVVQILLAFVFAYAGWTKMVKTGAELRATIPWITDVASPMVRGIGICEFLGAIGLILPAATRIRPRLTPIAATGLTTVMTLAVAFHLYRGDDSMIVVPSILAVASAVVAWGRFRKAPIVERGG
ncbi:MAG TPA: DoxX family protein [Polyangia bacterium]|nr:DoxX family protein [Polyangia bacterium]